MLFRDKGFASIYHDGHTAGQNSNCGLKACQQHVGGNAYPTGADDL